MGRLVFGVLLIILFILFLAVPAIMNPRWFGGVQGFLGAALFCAVTLLLPGLLLSYFGWRSLWARPAPRPRKTLDEMTMEELLEEMGIRAIKGVRCPYKGCNSVNAEAVSSREGGIESWRTHCNACGRVSTYLSSEEIGQLRRGLPL